MRERLPESISNTFALIHSIDFSVGVKRTRQDWPLLNGPLNKSYTMENQFCIVDVTAITGPATIIEDKLFFRVDLEYWYNHYANSTEDDHQ